MKSFILLFLSLLTFALLVKIDVDEETYGCKLPKEGEGKDQCCWVNSNGCCKPPQPNQACTMAITTCCKKRVIDELTGEVTYVYSHSYGGGIPQDS